MKILGLAGSNRKDGNSYLLLREMFQDLADVETRIVQVAELNIRPCELCFELCAQRPFACVIEDDFKMLLEGWFTIWVTLFPAHLKEWGISEAYRIPKRGKIGTPGTYFRACDGKIGLVGPEINSWASKKCYLNSFGI